MPETRLFCGVPGVGGGDFGAWRENDRFHWYCVRLSPVRLFHDRPPQKPTVEVRLVFKVGNRHLKFQTRMTHGEKAAMLKTPTVELVDLQPMSRVPNS